VLIAAPQRHRRTDLQPELGEQRRRSIDAAVEIAGAAIALARQQPGITAAALKTSRPIRRTGVRAGRCARAFRSPAR
jgi:hypothetical protein